MLEAASTSTTACQWLPLRARRLGWSGLDQHDDLLGLESDAESEDGDAQEGGGCVDGFGR